MTRGEVALHVLATGGKPDSTTHFLCPSGPQRETTHHLVPRGPAAAQEQTCRYCGKTDAALRVEHGL